LVSISTTCHKHFNTALGEKFHNRVIFVDISDGTAKDYIEWIDTKDQLPLPPEGEDCQTWGSSWNMVIETASFILFAPDSGQGLYRLVPGSIDLTDEKTMLFERWSDIKSAEWNDGFSCIKFDPQTVVHHD